MKTLLAKPFILAFALATTLILFSSCQKDEEEQILEKSELIGTWDIDSYKLDGDEYIGLLVTAATLRFHDYTGAQGIFEQTVLFADESEYFLEGAYSVDARAGKVTLDYTGDLVDAHITITDGTKMHWESEQDEVPLVILATKQ